MKKSILTLIFLSFAGLLMAHPPKSVNLTYNKEGKIKIVVVHNVKDVATHYIKQMIIFVDGKQVKTLDFKTQTNVKEEDVEVVVPEVKSGSEVKVKATCNIFGSKTGKIKIQ